MNLAIHKEILLVLETNCSKYGGIRMATIMGITMNYFMKSSLGPVDIKEAVLWDHSMVIALLLQSLA